MRRRADDIPTRQERLRHNALRERLRVYGWTHVRVPSQMRTDFGFSLANDDYNVIKVTPRTLAT